MFLGKTFKISLVVSTIAVFVTGVMAKLFKGLTEEKRISGLTRRQILTKIENAVKHNIESKKTQAKWEKLVSYEGRTPKW